MEEQPQVLTPEQPVESTQSKRPFYRHPMFFVSILVVLLVAVAVYLLPKSGPAATEQAIEYTTGLPKDRVGVQVHGLLRRYPLMDFNNGSINANINVFEGLTVYRGTKLEPGLAESWTNPDSTTWRIKLRKGVKFHSGDLVTAKDVKYTIEQAKASENADMPWVSQTMAARVNSVRIIDDYTVDLKTEQPDATLLSWLVYLGIVSQDQVKRDGLAKAVGTGPYKIISVSNDEVSLEANNAYWGGTPKVKKLVYRNVEDPDKAKAALENGTLDIISLQTVGNNELKSKGYQVNTLRSGGIFYLTFDINSEKSKHIDSPKNPFREKKVRKAVQLALDVSKMVAAAGINAEPVTQFGDQELVGFNSKLKVPSQNIEEAKKLLAEAGFENGFTVTLDAEQTPTNKATVEEIKKQLAEIGIIVNPNFMETDNYYLMLDSTATTNKSVDSAMLLTSYYPDTIDSLDLLDTIFHSHVGSHGYNNLNFLSNPEIDNTLDQAISTFDVPKRIKLTNQAHALIMEDVSSIPLYTETNRIVARDTVFYKPSISLLIQGFDISGRRKN